MVCMGVIHSDFELQASEAKVTLLATWAKAEEMAPRWPKSPQTTSSPGFVLMYTLYLITEPESTLPGLPIGIIGPSQSFASSLWLLGNHF